MVSYFNYYHDSKWHVPDFFPEKLIKMLPMEIDVASGEHYSTMAVLNTHDMDLRHIFDNCYFSVVTETVYDEHREHNDWHVETFLTEKTFKSIMNMHPFILLSAPGSLEHLRKLGYKTFPNSIDESYDKEINAVKRMDMVLEETKKLCALNINELHDWYRKLIPILEHNQKNLLTNVSKHDKLYYYKKFHY